MTHYTPWFSLLQQMFPVLEQVGLINNRYVLGNKYKKNKNSLNVYKLQTYCRRGHQLIIKIVFTRE